MEFNLTHGKKRNELLPYLLMAPTLIIFAVFVFWPAVYTLYLSFFDWNMIRPDKEFVGLSNYIAMFTDPDMYQILGNTMLYIGILLILNFVFPYIFAFVLEFVLVRYRGFFKTVFFLPSFISLVVGSAIFSWLLNPTSGPVSVLMSAVGVEMPIWGKTQGLVIVVISLITSWRIFGYNFIVLYAAVCGCSKEPIEAAMLDDVPLHQIFFHIVIPMSSASGIYILIMTVVQGLQYVYTPISVLTDGGPNHGSANLIYQSYLEGFGQFNTGQSSAISIFTMILFGILLFLEFRFVERGVHYES